MLDQATQAKIIAALETRNRPPTFTLAKQMGVPANDVWCLYQLSERRLNPEYGTNSKTNMVLQQLRRYPDYSDSRIAKFSGCTTALVSHVRVLLKYLQADPITAPHYGTLQNGAITWTEPTAEPEVEVMDNTLAQVLEARGKDYGDYAEKAQFVQGMKYLMRSGPNWDALDADVRESVEMIVHKMGRVLYGDPKIKDNFVDIAGYATLVANRL